MRFEEIVGQQHAVALLKHAVAERRVPHAYLFDGPAGVGKRSAAVGLAMALNCAQSGDGTACGACDSCRRIGAGIHPDVAQFAPQTTQIVVEQAQEIVALGQRGPHEAGARVIVIDDADRLNPNAGNCLLKTLEEPADGTHLVLVTSAPERVLPTLRSRTQRIRFGKIATSDLLALAERRAIERTRAEAAAVLADGSAGRFFELAEQTSEDDGQAASQILAALRPGPPSPGKQAVGQAAQPRLSRLLEVAAQVGDRANKETLPTVLALIAREYRDAMVRAAGAPDLALGDGKTNADQARPPANASPADLSRALQAIVDADNDLAANVNPVLAVERMLIQLARVNG